MTISLLTVGWREWVSLPDLGLPAIKAKIDTGAKTSALHALNVEPFNRDQKNYVLFMINPIRKNDDLTIQCEALVKDQRMVTDSGGHKEMRYVIETLLEIDNQHWLIDMTLTSRKNMRFKMLLGRQAMNDKILVDPSLSYQHGRMDFEALYKIKS